MTWLALSLAAVCLSGAVVQQVARSRSAPEWWQGIRLAQAWCSLLLALSGLGWFWLHGLERIDTGTSLARWGAVAAAVASVSVASRLAEFSTRTRRYRLLGPHDSTAAELWQRRPVRTAAFCVHMTALLLTLITVLLSTRPEESAPVGPLVVVVLSCMVLPSPGDDRAAGWRLPFASTTRER